MAGALQPWGGVRRDGEVLEGGGDEEEEGVREGAGVGGRVAVEEDPVRPASVRDLKTEGRGGTGEEMAKFFGECMRLKKRRRSAERY